MSSTLYKDELESIPGISLEQSDSSRLTELRHSDIVTYCASAIKMVRDSLNDDDCKTLSEEVKRRVMRIGRDLGHAIKGRRYNGIVVFEDEGSADIVVDCFATHKRLVISVSAEMQVRVKRITRELVEQTGWIRDIYNAEPLAEWLLTEETDAFTPGSYSSH